LAKLSHEEAVAAFTLRRPLFDAFANELKHLVGGLLKASAMRVQVVEARAKTLESFREKIARSGKNYDDPLSDLPDLCGCRIITYYGDEVGKISELIKNEFDVIEEEASHQPDQLEADRFGYLSMHYVVKLKAARSDLAEWRSYKDLHAEIQIRTVIQHAWSAVSHTLQYKQETSIPSALRRRLFRIAGLFELADEEFVGIRDQRARLERSTAEKLSKGERSIPLTSVALTQFITQWDRGEDVEAAAAAAGFDVVDEIDPDNMVISELYDLATRNGIVTIADLENAISPPQTNIFGAIYANLGEPWDVSLDFLILLLLIARYPASATEEWLTASEWAAEMKTALLAAIKEQENGG
jgi:ppGpp synthetase/RelA/SpoT-type nucleotidyltranferase